MPPGEPLTADRILDATEEMLRRYGPAKATVVDVARTLGVSHAAVYRHFSSKQELREAVTRRWLAASRDAIADDATLPPPDRLRAWSHAVLAMKRAISLQDPELFEAYGVLAQAHSAVADEHVAELVGHLERIVAAGMSDGSFVAGDAAATARAVFHALARFNDRALAPLWHRPGVEADLDAVCDLVLDGLRPRTPGERS
jgi:AcrR family transcriptional regulator